MTTFLKEANLTRDWFGVPDNEAEAMGRLAEPKGYKRDEPMSSGTTQATWRKWIGNHQVVITGRKGHRTPSHWLINIEEAGYAGTRSFAGGEKPTEMITDQITAMKKAEEAERYVPTMNDYKDMTPEEAQAKTDHAAKELMAYYSREPGSYTGD